MYHQQYFKSIHLVLISKLLELTKKERLILMRVVFKSADH